MQIKCIHIENFRRFHCVDCEFEVGLPHDDAEKLDRALAHFRDVSMNDIPSALADAIRETVELLP